MVKKIIVFFVFICAINMFIGAYIFASFNLVQASDFEERQGVIANSPIIVKDEENRNVGFRFQIEGVSKKFNIKGVFLELAEPSVYDLKKGDKIKFWVQKESSKIFVYRILSNPEGIWGLSLNDGTNILSLDQTITQSKGNSNLFFMALCLIFGLGTSFYGFKQYQISEKKQSLIPK